MVVSVSGWRASVVVHVSGSCAGLLIVLTSANTTYDVPSVAIRDFHYRRDFVTAEELVDAMNLPETSDYFRASMLPVSTESILHGTVFTIRYGRDNEVSHAFLPVGDATSYHLGMWVLVESIDRKRIEIDAAEIIAIERGSSLDIASTSIPMRRIFRPLTTLERDSFNTKRITETIDFHMLKHSLVDGPSPADLELTGLRYQWDKRKAIVYFRSSKTVRFNTLLYKLSMILKMRVHLVAEIGSFVPDGTGRGGKGIQRDTVE